MISITDLLLHFTNWMFVSTCSARACAFIFLIIAIIWPTPLRLYPLRLRSVKFFSIKRRRQATKLQHTAYGVKVLHYVSNLRLKGRFKVLLMFKNVFKDSLGGIRQST